MQKPSRKERKQKRKAKSAKQPKISNIKWDVLAREMGKLMDRTPQRPFQGELFIDFSGRTGCIPEGGCQSDYYYCDSCLAIPKRGIKCLDNPNTGKYIAHRLSETGQLTCYP